MRLLPGRLGSWLLTVDAAGNLDGRLSCSPPAIRDPGRHMGRRPRQHVKPMAMTIIAGAAVLLGLGARSLSAAAPASSAVVAGLMRREVTYAEYRSCVAAKRCARPRGRQKAALPVVGVTRDQASAYCDFLGGRLPTDAEWTGAARAAGASFPWGDDPLGGYSNCIRSERGMTLLPPGSRSDDTVEGIADLHGNALEWTSDGHVRGARYCHEPIDTRQEISLSGYEAHVGFRCVVPPRLDATASRVRSRLPLLASSLECHAIVSGCGCAGGCALGRVRRSSGTWVVDAGAEQRREATLEHWCFDGDGRGRRAGSGPADARHCVDVFRDAAGCDGECIAEPLPRCRVVGGRCRAR